MSETHPPVRGGARLDAELGSVTPNHAGTRRSDVSATASGTSAAWIDGSGGDARSRLLAAAGPVFAKHGFDRATLREISGAANVNVASIGYYFGDKMGLYLNVIREVRRRREARYPTPSELPSDPRRELSGLVHNMLSRMLAKDDTGWESQLLMREMQHPTPAFAEMVNESFRPIFQRLSRAIKSLIGSDVDEHVIQQLSLSVVGQCLYYRVGREVVDMLIPEPDREAFYDIESLSKHVTAVILCATSQQSLLSQKQELECLPHRAVSSPGGNTKSRGTPLTGIPRESEQQSDH